jgi:hypothetical protein
LEHASCGPSNQPLTPLGEREPLWEDGSFIQSNDEYQTLVLGIIVVVTLAFASLSLAGFYWVDTFPAVIDVRNGNVASAYDLGYVCHSNRSVAAFTYSPDRPAKVLSVEVGVDPPRVGTPAVTPRPMRLSRI